MIELSVAQVANIVNGTIHGSGEARITGSVVVDSRAVEEGSLFVAIAGEKSDGHDYVAAARAAGAAATLASRTVDGPCIVVADPLVAVAELARYTVDRLREAGTISIAAITGSQGKTSVKDLVAHILEADAPTIAAIGSFNNELGVPLTILRADEHTKWLVLEMGARGKGHISYLCSMSKPDVGAVINVGTAHVGEFGSVEAIAEAKGELVTHLVDGGTAVLNADDVRVAQMARNHAGPTLTFGQAQTADVRLHSAVTLSPEGFAQCVLEYAGAEWPVQIPQIGFHHAINAAAAFAIARALGIQPGDILAALATARARSAMRMESVRTPSGALILNDAYNANPESMAAALLTLREVAKEKSIAVLGAMLELGSDSEAQHGKIGELARELEIDEVIVIGETAHPIAVAAGSRAKYFDTVEAASETLSASLQASDTVLVKASRSIALEKLVAVLMSNT